MNEPLVDPPSLPKDKKYGTTESSTYDSRSYQQREFEYEMRDRHRYMARERELDKVFNPGLAIQAELTKQSTFDIETTVKITTAEVRELRPEWPFVRCQRLLFDHADAMQVELQDSVLGILESYIEFEEDQLAEIMSRNGGAS